VHPQQVEGGHGLGSHLQLLGERQLIPLFGLLGGRRLPMCCDLAEQPAGPGFVAALVAL
jgi:hypothetical protein